MFAKRSDRVNIDTVFLWKKNISDLSLFFFVLNTDAG